MKICILRLSAIGDCINAAAAAGALMRHFPDAKITWIISAPGAALLTPLLPGVDFVICRHKGIRGALELRKRLSGERFDVLLMMQYALSASLASLGIRADLRVGFDRERSRELQWLFAGRRIPSGGGRHVVDGFMAFAAACGVPDPVPRWDLTIPADVLARGRELLGQGTGRTALLAPCTSRESKNWPLASLLEVASGLLARGLRVFLLGGRSEAERRLEDALRERCPGITSLVGRTSLPECYACVRLADLLISADTAQVHMANAAGTPVIGLYATHDPARVGPYLDRQYCVSVYEELAREEYGRSPEELPWRTRIRIPGAMERITAAMILEKADRLLADLAQKVAGRSGMQEPGAPAPEAPAPDPGAPASGREDHR